MMNGLKKKLVLNLCGSPKANWNDFLFWFSVIHVWNFRKFRSLESLIAWFCCFISIIWEKKKESRKKKTGVEIGTSKQIPPKGKESLISVSGGHRSLLGAICLLIMIAKSKENFSCLTNTTTKWINKGKIGQVLLVYSLKFVITTSSTRSVQISESSHVLGLKFLLSIDEFHFLNELELIQLPN